MKMAYLRVQKECSARLSKAVKRLTSHEWTLGYKDHDNTFTTFRMTTTYHRNHLPYLLLLPNVGHWLVVTNDGFPPIGTGS